MDFLPERMSTAPAKQMSVDSQKCSPAEGIGTVAKNRTSARPASSFGINPNHRRAETVAYVEHKRELSI